GTIAVTVLLAKSPDQWPQWLRDSLGESLSGLISDFRRRTIAAPGVHLIAFGISVVVWLLDFISVWLLALGVGLPLPFFETCIAVSVAYASTALPISIGGHGVREGALLFVLGLFGLIGATGPDHERALILAVLVWAVTMIWSLFGGLVLVLTRQDRVAARSP
ncbi:MAG TPA: lysylphosphatidylglycerol synthase domain-containing protein, partial [Opitutaceae bacterium]|nr:lysylphosphatidylglycerol synthase domain-containing protein [Opitutaceae bacterium]